MEFVGITVLFLDEKVNSVIHGFTLVGRANHYMPSLKADSIVKVHFFEVARCSSMYKITDHPFLIRFISLTIIDEVITGAAEINLQSRLDYVLGKSVMSRVLTSPKKQLESLSVFSLIYEFPTVPAAKCSGQAKPLGKCTRPCRIRTCRSGQKTKQGSRCECPSGLVERLRPAAASPESQHFRV
ncbi:hypothetical protein DY000_02057191 [Brassica cretica]|uniref:DUF223 domain-containing protein n=1 Tax=Brassica cretica TaxID=69181 RepID=A0ABQ7AFD3_BRACR|nr:hypothetical protein DY000_02057191 [Brassica cretica]